MLRLMGAKAAVSSQFAILLLAACGLCFAGEPVQSAEYGKGVVLLGSNASMAGFVPPPGTYLSSQKYYYTGSAIGGGANSVALGELGNLELSANVKVDARSFVDINSALWVAPRFVLGGHFGFGVVVPVGWQDVSVDVNALATLTLPNGTTLNQGGRLRLDDDTFSFGDPLMTAFLGWHGGNWHWKVAGLLNIPVGQYSKTDIANMGFNRWAADLSMAVTWLDPKVGLEVSSAAGFTFNGENAHTDYKTGTEFHLEAAVMQHFSPQFAVGIVGYHYQQVTGDSGSGANLGAFKGRVTALGPNANYNFKLGAIPVSTSLRWLSEFDVQNRLKGDAVLFNAVIPLGGPLP